MVALLPYGSWPTPITSELVVRAAARPQGVAVDGDDVWWGEFRPGEGGRTAVVRDGTDVLPAPWNARTRVHEYGGGAWAVADGTLWFTEFTDQRLYRVDPGAAAPVPVTPEPAIPSGVRFADLRPLPGGAGVLAVRETHTDSGAAADVVNELVRVGADGAVEVLVSGPDFVSDPALAPDDATLAWLRWDHPDMPWDAAQLVVRAPDDTETVVAGGPGESVVQPTWAADGTLWFLCDATDVWSLHRWRPGGPAELVLDVSSDIASPQWVFGQRRFDLLPGGRIVLAFGRAGVDRLAVLGPDGGLRELDLPYAAFASLTAHGDAVVCTAGGPVDEPVVLRVAVDTGAAEVLAPGARPGSGPGLVLPARARDVPDLRRRHRDRRGARPGVPADQPAGERPGG